MGPIHYEDSCSSLSAGKASTSKYIRCLLRELVKTFFRLASLEVEGRGLLCQDDHDHDADSCAAVLTRPPVPAAAHAEDSHASILLPRPLVPAADH